LPSTAACGWLRTPMDTIRTLVLLMVATTALATTTDQALEQRRGVSLQWLQDGIRSFGKIDADSKSMGPMGWEVCNTHTSKRYAHHWNLTAEHNRNGFWLQMPANHRALFFGHSYMRQLLDSILVASSDAITGIVSCRFRNAPDFTNETCLSGSKPYVGSCNPYAVNWSSWGNNRARENGGPDEGQENGGRRFDPMRVFFDRINSSVVFMHNYAPLQHSSCTLNLRHFLSQHGPFDSVVFMLPHPDCWFTWLAQPRTKRGAYCFSLEDSADNMPRLGLSGELHDLFRPFAARVLEVVQWSEFNSSHPTPLAHPRLATAPFFERAGWCRTDTCSDNWGSHQCMPGAITEISTAIVDWWEYRHVRNLVRRHS
jgi:hypothetical protein